MSLPQIINTKKHTKTACLSRVFVQYINRNILQLCKIILEFLPNAGIGK